MPFVVGAKVRISPTCEEPKFIEQAGHLGVGILTESIGDTWWWVQFGDYRNNYGEQFLELVGETETMPEPEVSLDEIHAGQDIYEGLRERS